MNKCSEESSLNTTHVDMIDPIINVAREAPIMSEVLPVDSTKSVLEIEAFKCKYRQYTNINIVNSPKNKKQANNSNCHNDRYKHINITTHITVITCLR